MHYVFCNSSCVKLSFAYSCSLRVDVNHFLYHSACVKLNFAHTSSVRFDVFILSCNSRCLKLKFCGCLLFKNGCIPSNMPF